MRASTRSRTHWSAPRSPFPPHPERPAHDGAAVYRRREPTATPLYPLVQHHLETFLAEAAEADPGGEGVPGWVEDDCDPGRRIAGRVRGCGGVSVWTLDPSKGGSMEDPEFLYARAITGVSVGHSASFTWDGKVLIFGHEPGGGVGARCQATSTLVDRTLFFLDARTGTELGVRGLARSARCRLAPGRGVVRFDEAVQHGRNRRTVRRRHPTPSAWPRGLAGRAERPPTRCHARDQIRSARKCLVKSCPNAFSFGSRQSPAP